MTKLKTIEYYGNKLVNIDEVIELIDKLEYGSLTNVAGYKEELKKRITGEQKQ